MSKVGRTIRGIAAQVTVSFGTGGYRLRILWGRHGSASRRKPAEFVSFFVVCMASFLLLPNQDANGKSSLKLFCVRKKLSKWPFHWLLNVIIIL